MRRNWKKTPCLFIGAVLLIALIGLITSQSGSHAIAEDPPDPFVPLTNGAGIVYGVQDTAPGGLMWGKELNENGRWLIFYVEEDVTHWANAENAKGSASLAGGYSDWRPATVGEILTAIDHGLLTYLDFSYCFESLGTGILRGLG